MHSNGQPIPYIVKRSKSTVNAIKQVQLPYLASTSSELFLLCLAVICLKYGSLI